MACIPVALRYKGSEWGSQMGYLDSKMHYVGEKVWGRGLGIFIPVGCNGPCRHVDLERLNWPTKCIPVALGFKRSERESKLGPVANNGENIASGRQSLVMRSRNLRPCERERALSACRPLRPVWGLPGVPVALS